MKKWLLRLVYAALVLAPIGAIADYTATTGTGTTVFAFVCSVSKVCPAQVLINSSNTEIATASNPVRTDPTGTTTQPVSLAAGSAIAGKVGIDQTTPGTTNGVQVNAALPAGTNLMGKVGIDQTTPGTTNAVVATPTTAGGLTVFFLQPTASDNHTNIKNGAGQVYHITATNNSATINYLRFFDLGTGFNGCASATGFKWQVAIPASTSGAGFVQDIAMGIAFGTGISICVSSGYSTTDVTNATASAMSLLIGYK